MYNLFLFVYKSRQMICLCSINCVNNEKIAFVSGTVNIFPENNYKDVLLYNEKVPFILNRG